MKRYAIALFFLLASCSASSRGPAEPGPEPPTPPPASSPLESLGWETGHPERKAWSSQVYELLSGELFADFDAAADASRFCPKYAGLSHDQKATMWSELISAVSLFESGWNPLSRMEEPTLGTDPVTGQPVYSEGLLQLSYQDVRGAPYCRFDWQKDKDLAPNDPARTILDPERNLDCGVRILAAQIRARQSVILSSGVYWAVLKENGRYQKIDEIVARTSRFSFCND